MNIDKTISRNLNSLVKNHIKRPKNNNEMYLLLKTTLQGTYYEPLLDNLDDNITGTFATCIYCTNTNYIIKTNIFEKDVTQDGTNFWLKYIINVPNNNNLPNLIHYYFYENYYFVIMERLYDVSNYIPYIESSCIIDVLNKIETYTKGIDYNFFNSKKFVSKYTPILIKTLPTFINILTPIVNNNKEITLDICSENIMVRSYKNKIEFILLDPFWREV